jgi:SAM-dependent methyltransferase
VIDPKSDPLAKGWNQVATARIRATVDFLNCERERISGPILDIGGESPLGRALQAHYGCELINTNIDLDTDPLPGLWTNVFSFEVIEHLGNPLRHLMEIQRVLQPGGVLYLSTPLVVNRLRPTHWLRGQHHLFEMDWNQLAFLIERAGFEVERQATCRYLETWKHFTGVRPIIKFFTDRCVLLKLVPSHGTQGRRS